ncbi:hypothetical protein CRUP_011244 [Coryphaenoides rupestris]|nr:hypothetical protein CRUP_011244 [Coryphaenoides rupestris]
MRNFNWDTLSKARVEGTHNIWTAQRVQGEYELDTAHMEELFSHGAPGASASQDPKTLHRQSLRGLPPSAAGAEMVSILNPKRSMNVGIFLKQPVRDMIADISSGTSQNFATGKLREFCKMLPEEGEVGDLNNFKGNESALAEADLFMLLLVRIPSYEERLSCLVLQEEFQPLVEDMKKSVSMLTAATKGNVKLGLVTRIQYRSNCHSEGQAGSSTAPL